MDVSKKRMPEGKATLRETMREIRVWKTMQVRNKTDCTSVDRSGGFVCKSLGWQEAGDHKEVQLGSGRGC